MIISIIFVRKSNYIPSTSIFHNSLTDHFHIENMQPVTVSDRCTKTIERINFKNNFSCVYVTEKIKNRHFQDNR